jgi:hypothetical protein
VMCLAGAAASWTRGGKGAAVTTENAVRVENLVPEPAH